MTVPESFASVGSPRHKIVYTIVKRERDGKKFWLRIGAAFRNQDGSLNVYLDAMPTNGQLHIRDPRPEEPRRNGLSRERGFGEDAADLLAG